MPHHPHHTANPLREIIIGAAAGVGAAFVMNQFQSLWGRYAPSDLQPSGGGDPATVKAAQRVSLAVGRGDLPVERKEDAGEAVHYATGAALGAMYGVLASSVRGADLGGGLPFGAAVYKILDEGVVPQLQLGPPAESTDEKTRLYGLISHLVFGFTADRLRRVLGGH